MDRQYSRRSEGELPQGRSRSLEPFVFLRSDSTSPRVVGAHRTTDPRRSPTTLHAQGCYHVPDQLESRESLATPDADPLSMFAQEGERHTESCATDAIPGGTRTEPPPLTSAPHPTDPLPPQI